MRMKQDVNPIGIRPELLLAMMIADTVYTEAGYELVITSINDGTHSKTSRHYQGMAFDCRIRHIPGPIVQQIFDALKLNLGSNYFVLLESNHIHISYKPRKP